MFPTLEELRRRRIRVGLTQGKWARAAGVSQSLVAKIEHGKISPSYRNVVALVTALEREEERCLPSAILRDIATQHLLRIHRKDRLSDAAHLMRKHQISQLPVMEGEAVLGSLTDHIVIACLTDPVRSSKMARLTVGEVMQEPFPQLDAGTPVSVAATLLKHTSAILVTFKGRIYGLLTKSDLFRAV